MNIRKLNEENLNLPIFPAKFRNPTLSVYLRRDRLFKYMDELSNIPLMVIHADAGYGKTTLIASYLQERKRNAIWYHIGTTDRIKGAFINHLAAAVKSNNSIDLAENNKMFQLSDDPEMNGVSLATYLCDTSTTLVIEDYDRIKHNDIDRTILAITEHLTPGSQVFLLSRTRPLLPLTRLVINGIAKIVVKSDLAFTLEETAALFSNIYNRYLTSHELNMIKRRLEGWAAGLRLANEAIKVTPEKGREKFWTRFMQSPSLFDYLAEEVLSTLPSETLDFLHKTSIFAVLQADLIAEMFGDLNPSLMLERLSKENLFTTSIDTTGTYYRYHNLFRQHLYQGFVEKTGLANVQELHAAAAELYEKRGIIDQAIVHSLLARKEQKIPPLINVIAKQHGYEVILQLMEGWLEKAFPGIEDICGMALRLMIPISFYETVLPDLLKAAEGTNEDVDLFSQAYAQHRLGTYYYYKGDFEQCLCWLTRSKDNFKELGNRIAASVSNILLGQAHIFIGKPEKAGYYLDEALEWAGDESTYSYKNVLFAKGELALAFNRFEEAETLACRALDLNNPFFMRNSFCYCTLAAALVFQGKQQEALNACDKAFEQAHIFDSPVDSGFVYMRRAIVLRETGNIPEARVAVEKAISFLEGFDFLLARALLVRADLAFIARDNIFERLWSETRAFWEQHGYQMHEGYDGLAAPALIGKRGARPLEFLLKSQEPSKIQFDLSVSPTPLYIQILGPLKLIIQGEESKPSKWGRTASRRLFFLMLLQNGKLVNRDTYLEILWPEGDPVTSANHFSVALHNLRRVFYFFPHIIERHVDMYCLRLPKGTFLDIEAYDHLAVKGLAENNADLLVKADALYQGDFLEEYPYDGFLETERLRLREQQIKILMKLGGIYFQAGRADEALAWYRKLSMLDPFSEEPVLRVMEILQKKGEPAAALEAYKRFSKHIKAELELEPTERIRNLYHHILSEQK